MEIVFLILFSLSISSSAQAKPVNGFTIDLIHRDSPLSPFYNSSLNQTELLRNAALRSISRINNFNLSIAYENKVETAITPNDGDYLMKISIGTPPVESLAIADTGSDLIWIQCQPCHDCYQQNAPIFDPKKSSTYQVITCHTKTCDMLPVHACGGFTECRYEYNYGDKSVTVGELATDTITFGSNSSQQVVSPKTIIGCGHVNYGNYKPTGSGMVGLGQGPLSFVSQLGDQIGHKFSYCLLPPFSNSTSKMKFGSEVTISGNEIVSIPLVAQSSSSFYHLNLLEVSIGKDKVQPGNSSVKGDIIMDVGSTLTFLETSLYDSVESAIIEAIGDDRQPISNPPTPFKLCYLDASIDVVPDITFSFSGASNVLELNKFNTFGKLNNLLCFTMAPKEGYSIFGNLAQIGFKVVHDLLQKTVSFAPADCTME